MTIPADPLYQHLLLTAEEKFWRCVETGEVPHLFGVEPPRAKIEAVRTVDMSGSNAWAEFAGLYQATRQAGGDHERSKAELKALVPEDLCLCTLLDRGLDLFNQACFPRWDSVGQLQASFETPALRLPPPRGEH